MQINQTKRTPFQLKLSASPGRYLKPCFVDAKIDGEYGAWFVDGIYSKSGLNRSCFPAADLCRSLASAVSGITGMQIHDFEILGELHYGDGKAGDLYKLLANKSNDALSFTVFDYYAPRYPTPLIDRRETLVTAFSKAFPKPPQAMQLVPFRHCEPDEITESIQHFTSVGYEGIVIKPIDAWIPIGFKFKSKQTSDLKVLSADPIRERIGIEHPLNPGKELCGVKMQGQSRNDLVGKIVEIEYLQQLFNDKGVLTSLRNPIFLRVRDDKSEVSL